MTHVTRCTLGTLALLLALPGSSLAQDEAAKPGMEAAADKTSGLPAPKLTGKWIRNDDLSDDPAAVLRQAMRSGGARRPGGGGGRGGRGGGGGGGRGRGPGGGGPGAGGFGDALSAAKQLSIVQDDSTVTMVARGGASQMFRLGGEPMKRRDRRGQEIEMRAEWANGALLVTTSGGQAGSERRYVIDYKTGQLIVTTRMSLPQSDREVEFKVVYEPIGGQEE